VDSGAGRRRTELFGSFRGLAMVVVIGAILVVAWLVLVNGSLTLPRFSTTGPVVRNSVAVIVACGNMSGEIAGMTKAGEYAPEPRTGTWASTGKGATARSGTTTRRIRASARRATSGSSFASAAAC
jgi:hypothetical protein